MIDFKIYNDITKVPNAWDGLPTHDIFLKKAFLEALQKSTPRNISSYYLCLFKQEKLIGIAILQRVEMYTDDIFRKTSNNTFKRIAKQIIAKIVRGNTIVVGNLMHTGQHGLFFLTEEISQADYLDILNDAINQLSQDVRNQFNKKIRIIAFKDYFEDDAIHDSKDFFNKQNLYRVQVQPNMLFTIPKEWHSKEDYIAAFTKKYRDRYKRARKKGDGIVFKELDLEAINTNAETLFDLYENVSDNAGINSFKLAQNHFYNLKLYLKDRFQVFGCYLDNDLIGFYSLILNNDRLETYFLGYNQELQHQYQIYLNMLFNMVCFGIENKFKTVVFARTAMEIKSSIGAKPYTMHVYLKHTNNFIANTLLKFIVRHMNPIKEWQERHPFK